MRGIVPAVLIHQISELLSAMGDERPFYSHFDLIAGTSTGALLALALSAPIERTRLKIEENGPFPVYESTQPTFWQRIRKARVEATLIGTLPWGVDTASLERLYRDHGRTIFPKSQGRIISQIFVDKYDEEPLENFLRTTFGDIALSEAVVPTLIMAYDAEEGRPFSMSSSDSHDFLFWEAARASSAAPTFFKPAYLHDRTLKRMVTLIDGGVVANNPSLYAYIEAKRLYPHAESYHILSLSTASSDFSFKVSGAGTGVIGWIDPAKGAPIQKIYASAQMQNVDQVAASIPELTYTRIHTPLAEEYKLDETGANALNAMAKEARQIFNEHKQRIEAYATMLAGRTNFDQLNLGPVDAQRPAQGVTIPPPPQRELSALSSLDSLLRRYQLSETEVRP
jgi:patatin-like phospholipase/acyl hydrolase